MNSEEYERYNNEDIATLPERFGLGDLTDQSNRTLMYGYELDRSSTHVFIQDNELRMMCYDRNEILFRASSMLVISECSPSKRAYPRATDFEFSRLMRKWGYPLTFTTMDEKQIPGSNGYYGKVF